MDEVRICFNLIADSSQPRVFQEETSALGRSTDLVFETTVPLHMSVGQIVGNLVDHRKLTK